MSEKILQFHREHRLGPMRIVWCSTRHHGIRTSDAGVHRVLRRNDLDRLPRSTRVRKVHTRRHDEQVPGHDIQMDVKFLTFSGTDGRTIRRFRDTAIDEATPVRALKVHERHDQADATNHVNHVTETFPFRVKEIRTDNGHEFQTKLHQRVEEKGTVPYLPWLQGRKLTPCIPARTVQTDGKLSREAFVHDADLD